MARFTLSIGDDVAAQLDAFAAANNLNRSQAAEQIFRSAFAGGQDNVEPEEDEQTEGSQSREVAYLADQVLEIQDYLIQLIANHQTLRNLVITTTDMDSVSEVHHPRLLPEAPWVRRARGY